MVVTLPFRPDVLQGRHALVCGGSAGIGAAIATTLASCGATVTSIARTEHSLDHLDGDGHQALVSDLEDLEALDDMLGRIHHPIHILINNTGGPPSGPLLEADLAAFEPALARLLHAPHHLTRALVPGMEAEGFGRIVNIVSTSVREPIANIGVSNTVRGAVANWAKTLATELAPCITINNILPGFTDTRRLVGLAQQRFERHGTPIDTTYQGWIDQTPIRRLIDPMETAAAVVYLCLPIAGAIRGVSLAVDGGRSRSV